MVQKKNYQPSIPDGIDIQKRVEKISQKSGKKMYHILREAIEIGLKQLETQNA